MSASLAILTIGIRTIQQGQRTGEKVNDVKDIEAIDDDDEAPESEDEGSDDDY